MKATHRYLLLTLLVLSGCEETNNYTVAGPAPSNIATREPVYGPLLLGYDFEEVSGASMLDQSENKLNMLVIGCSRIEGPVGKALSCGEAGNSIIPFEDSDLIRHLHLKTEISFQFWLNYSYIDQEYGTIIELGGTSLRISGKTLHFTPSYYSDLAMDYPLDADTWYNLAVTFNGETTKFYVNGNSTGSFNLISPLGHGFGDNEAAIFPNYYEGRMSAAIDNLRVHDVVLSDEEILASYQADIP